MTAEITQAAIGFVTPGDYATVDSFLADCGVSPDRPGFDRAKYEDFRQTLAIYGAALTRAVRTQARDTALDEAAKLAEGHGIYWRSGARTIATAIRNLKTTPTESE